MKMNQILGTHFKGTAERCRKEPAVLTINDANTLNFSDFSEAEGFDALGEDTKHCGFLQVGLAVTAA